MAKVTVVEEERPRPPRRVILDLSEEEASVIRLLIGCVDGGDESWRNVASGLFSALRPLFETPGLTAYPSNVSATKLKDLPRLK